MASRGQRGRHEKLNPLYQERVFLYATLKIYPMRKLKFYFYVFIDGPYNQKSVLENGV
jgi:hypothetical protein